MRKLLITMVVALGSTLASFALDFSPNLGAKLIYASRHDQIGLGVNYQIGITKNLRVDPEFQYFFRTDGVSAWDINCNLEYVTTLFDDLSFYPLLGISFSHWGLSVPTENGYHYGTSTNRLGANLGIGTEYNFSDRLSGVFEIRGQFMGKDKSHGLAGSQCIIGAGLKYKF